MDEQLTQIAAPDDAAAPQSAFSSPDLGKIKRNVQSMLDQGAEEGEIDTYVAGEGVTAEQLRADRSVWQRVTGAVGDAADYVVDAYNGPSDPRFEGVKAFTGEGINDLETRSGIELGKATTFDDAAYGDVLRKQLGDRLIRSEPDVNGYEVLTYLDDDGQEKQAYVNQPCLDYQDFDRGASAALPFMIGGGAGGLAAKALGGSLAVRMGAQATAGATASIAADDIAGDGIPIPLTPYRVGGLGSEQGIDPLRAVIAGAGASLFEGLSGPISKVWRAFMGRKGVVGADGKLTEEAAAHARKMGLDPADMDERLAKAYADDLGIAADPAEAAAKARSAEFGIEASVGQRTKDSKALGIEEETRRGLFGDRAQNVMTGFDKRQAQAIEGAVHDNIGGRLAPQAAGREPATLGQHAREGVRAAKDTADQAENQLWESLGPMYPKPGVVQETLPAALANQVSKSGIRPDPQLTPAAHKMASMLDDYMAGRPMTSPYAVLGEDTAEIGIDGMRRRLLGLYSNADTGADKKAAKALYDGYNDWIDDIAQRAAIQGDVGGAAKLVAARGFTRDMKGLFEPRDKRGRLTPAARKIAAVMEEADSPEGALNSLLGRGGPTGAAPEGTMQALKHMKRILGEKHRESWDNVRLAYWTRLAVDRQGKLLTPGRLRNNIDAAFHNQQTVMSTLFTRQEQNAMRRLSRTLDDVTYTPPNPSGTSYELERMRNRSRGSALKVLAQTQQKRELFSKHNVIGARIWQLIARRLPFDPMGLKEQAGAKVAEQVIRQGVRGRRPPSQAYVGGTIGAEQSPD